MDISNRHTISAHIPVKNCAALLYECLKHLLWVDEIIVGDASDNDEIKKMIQSKYPKVKHFFDRTPDIRIRLENSISETESDFILWVSSDEFYTRDAAIEILDSIKKPCKYDGFGIPSISYNYGACLGEGATQLRLVRKKKFYFNMKTIHEMPEVEGPVKILKQPYHHHNNPTLGMTAIKYFGYEAVNAFNMDTEELNSLSLDNLSALSFHKNTFINLLRINWRFIRSYWAYRRFGFAGLCMAYSSVFQTIAAHVCPTEELRMKKGTITRDRRGYY